MTVQDDLGRLVGKPRRPERIISLVPNITETLFALGAAPRLVGVTRYCSVPAGASRLPAMGGTKNPDCRAVIAARPDLVFMSEEENRREDFNAIVAAGVEVFVSLVRRVEDVVDWIRRVGEVIECEARADELSSEVASAMRALRREVPAGSEEVPVFCPIWRKPWMSFNGDTYASSVLQFCAARNVCAGESERYCRVSLEDIATRGPRMVLLPDEPFPFEPKHVPELRGLVPSPRGVRFVDGRALSWYGSRTSAGLQSIRSAVRGDGE